MAPRTRARIPTAHKNRIVDSAMGILSTVSGGQNSNGTKKIPYDMRIVTSKFTINFDVTIRMSYNFNQGSDWHRNTPGQALVYNWIIIFKSVLGKKALKSAPGKSGVCVILLESRDIRRHVRRHPELSRP